MVKLSARVMMGNDGEEVGVDFYVRAVETGAGGRAFSKERVDMWAAFREEPVFVVLPGSTDRVCLLRVERVSDAPRETPAAAAEDMYAAIRVLVDPDRLSRRARLVRGDVPELPQRLGADPMGDA